MTRKLPCIGAYSVLLYISSTYATVADPVLIVQSVLVIVLVVMTPTKPRRKKSRLFFLEIKNIISYTLDAGGFEDYSRYDKQHA